MSKEYKDNIKRETVIKRIKKERDFTIVNNEILKRKDLSWKAKGIMAYILSLPDDWKIILEEISKHATDGKTSFNSGWKELKKAGYVKNVAVRDKNTKKILYWMTLVDEDGSLRDDTHNYETHNLKTYNLETHNVENQTLQSTYELSTYELSTESTKDNTRFSNASEIKKQKDKEIEEKFEEWYDLYSNKKDRAKALKSFKTKYKKHGYEKIVEGTKEYLKTVTDKKYQKYPATFLNAESYLDIDEFKEMSKNLQKGNNIKRYNDDFNLNEI